MADTTPAAETVVVSTPTKPEHGAQVHLTGDARAAARGALGGSIMDNMLAMRGLQADGTVADGYTPDGTTVTGKRQPDDRLAEAQDTPSGKPEPTRIEVENADAAAEVQAPAGVEGTPFTPAPDPDGKDEAREAAKAETKAAVKRGGKG